MCIGNDTYRVFDIKPRAFSFWKTPFYDFVINMKGWMGDRKRLHFVFGKTKFYTCYVLIILHCKAKNHLI